MTTRFRLGLVSNCWWRQLAAGDSLFDLVGMARERGLTHFEMRQSALGSCENSDLFPIPERLGDLARSSTDCSFNLAIAFPFFDVTRKAADPLFKRAREAAQSLSPDQPHLRLVDLESHLSATAETHLDERIDHVCELAESMRELGGVLSIENSPFQPWPILHQLLRGCQKKLGEREATLKLCFDPCNLFPKERLLVPTAIRQLVATDMSMLHFKQRQGEGVDTRFCDGELNWSDQLRGVEEIDYRGLGLFEITAADEFWANLDSSLEYLNSLDLP